MDVNIVKTIGTNINGLSPSNTVDTKTNTAKNDGIDKASQSIALLQKGDQNTQKQQISGNDLKTMTEEMNKFMQLMNADLQFTMHEKTQQLMVQVVDTKDQKVLREFPSHEFLDTIAKIREYVGLLLDKKA